MVALSSVWRSRSLEWVEWIPFLHFVTIAEPPARVPAGRGPLQNLYCRCRRVAAGANEWLLSSRCTAAVALGLSPLRRGFSKFMSCLWGQPLSYLFSEGVLVGERIQFWAEGQQLRVKCAQPVHHPGKRHCNRWSLPREINQEVNL